MKFAHAISAERYGLLKVDERHRPLSEYLARSPKLCHESQRARIVQILDGVVMGGLISKPLDDVI